MRKVPKPVRVKEPVSLRERAMVAVIVSTIVFAAAWESATFEWLAATLLRMLLIRSWRDMWTVEEHGWYWTCELGAHFSEPTTSSPP